MASKEGIAALSTHLHRAREYRLKSLVVERGRWSRTAGAIFCALYVFGDSSFELTTLQSLITFNNTASPPPRVRRQLNSSPQVYNVTQNFAASAGTTYTLSAFASEASNGGVSPDCTINICGDSTCGPV